MQAIGLAWHPIIISTKSNKYSLDCWLASWLVRCVLSMMT